MNINKVGKNEKIWLTLTLTFQSEMTNFYLFSVSMYVCKRIAYILFKLTDQI